MFFKYAPGLPPDAPLPRPVYARVDQTERVDDDDASSLVLLDCIDAEWLDDNADRADHLSDPGFEEADRWISVIAISSDRLSGSAKDGGELAEWYRLELDHPVDGTIAEQFHNLFQDPTERGVIHVRPVTPSESEMLSELAGWRGIEETPRPDIEKLLNCIGSVDAIAIYDVGHGAATRIAFARRAGPLFRSRRLGDRQLAQLSGVIATVLHDGPAAGRAVALGLGPLVVSIARPAGAGTPLDPADTGRGRRPWGRTRPVSGHAEGKRHRYLLVALRDAGHRLATDGRDALPGPGTAQKSERERARPLDHAERPRGAVAWGCIARIRLSERFQLRLSHGPAPRRKVQPENHSFSQRQAAKPSRLFIRDRQLLPPPPPQNRPHAAPIMEEECAHRAPGQQWPGSCRHRSRGGKPAIEAAALRKLHVPTRYPAMDLTARTISGTSPVPQSTGRLHLESVRRLYVGLQSFRSMSRMDASLMKASALRLRFSQSLASRRQRLSQAMVRSTTQRLGWTTKPFTRSDRLTISVSRSGRMPARAR